MMGEAKLIRLAWRNVRRNRRRSVITILSIAVGLAGLTFLWGTIDGQNGQMIDNSTRYFAGDVQVHVKGYHDDPSLDLAIADAGPVVQAIRHDPGVVAATVRLEGGALASRGDRSRGVLVVGVSPSDETRVSTLFSAIKDGAPLGATDSNGVLIGIKLAESLGLSVGDDVILVGQAYDGSIASARVPVRGIFNTRIDQYDGYMAVMPLAAVREFFVAPGGATAIALRLEDRDRLSTVAARLGALGDAYEVVGWPRLLPEVANGVRFHEVVSYVIVFIFFVVVAAAVANPILMAVLERTREFGVVLAVGMAPGRLLRLVLWEAVLLGVAGVLIGNVIGLGTTLYFGYVGIDVSAFEAAISTMPGATTTLEPVARVGRSVMMSLMVFAVACVVAIYPAAKAARLNPVDAIRGIGSRMAGSGHTWWRRNARVRRAGFQWPPFVLIASRNVLRNPRRTAITVGGTAFAILSYILLFGYFDGFTEGLIDTATRYQTGHAQIERPGFRKDYAPEVSIDNPTELLARTRRSPHVVAAAPRVQAQAIASSPAKSLNIALIGVDPALEREVTLIHQAVVEGAALASGQDRDIVIGRKLAQKLQVRLGEKVVVMTQAWGGELATAAYRVSGIFVTESSSFDEGMAFVTVSAAQALLALENRASTINLLLDDRARLADVMAQLEPAVSASGYAFVPWQELLPQLDEMVQYVRPIRLIIVAVLLAIVACAIMNTVFMSVAERTRELGVMTALGTRPMAIVRMVAYETAALMTVASILGYTAGVLAVRYLGRVGIDQSAFFRDYNTIPGITGVVYPKLFAASIALPGIALFVASVLIAMYPAGKAARLDPAPAIRHT